MDGLDTTLRIVASIATIVTGSITFYAFYKGRKKKNEASRNTDEPSKTEPVTDSELEV